MNVTPITSKGEQAKSQLIAAALAQFGESGLHATTRDIAAQAGQNIAAITYYFGSKEDLYQLVRSGLPISSVRTPAPTRRPLSSFLPTRSPIAKPFVP